MSEPKECECPYCVSWGRDGKPELAVKGRALCPDCEDRGCRTKAEWAGVRP